MISMVCTARASMWHLNRVCFCVRFFNKLRIHIVQLIFVFLIFILVYLNLSVVFVCFSLAFDLLVFSIMRCVERSDADSTGTFEEDLLKRITLECVAQHWRLQWGAAVSRTKITTLLNINIWPGSHSSTLTPPSAAVAPWCACTARSSSPLAPGPLVGLFDLKMNVNKTKKHTNSCFRIHEYYKRYWCMYNINESVIYTS